MNLPPTINDIIIFNESSNKNRKTTAGNLITQNMNYLTPTIFNFDDTDEGVSEDFQITSTDANLYTF